jgi:hypothetical protein
MCALKTKGILNPARQNWGDLSEEIKKTVASQVARYLLEIFALRFESACSIYLSSLSFHLIVIVGPMVGTTVLSMALPESLLRLSHKTLI